MPYGAWSNKDERQYEHVKDSELDVGRSDRRATEIAARTVNKQRRLEGRTKAQRDASRDELYAKAKELGIRGRSSMTKDQLRRAVQRAE